MTVTLDQLGEPIPEGGWPDWIFTAHYDGAAHPLAVSLNPPSEGANCQLFAYATVRLFGLTVPPHRSSELWEDGRFAHIGAGDVRRLDLVLFNRSSDAWGAHIAVVVAGGFLHLCAEVGRPTVWQWSDFAERDRYRAVVGAIRVAR